MKCSEARAALPLLIYGDTGPQERAALEEHLAHCGACRRERQALENVRHLLDTAAPPCVEVDLPRLHRSLADRQLHKARQWRRVACALAAVAAVLLFLAGLRLEVRMEAGRLVLTLGDPPAAPTPGPVPPEPVVIPGEPPETTEAELRVLRELIHALKGDADGRDRRFEERLDRLERQVEALEAQGEQRWSTTEQEMAALYLLARKGEKP